MILPLALGVVLAVGALAYVLYPLFFRVRTSMRVATIHDGNDGDTAITALREIEFDRVTGKLSDVDYAQLKTRYTQAAVNAMRSAAPVATDGPPTDDEVEATGR